MPGLAVRRVAADLIDDVLRRQRTLDEGLDATTGVAGLAALEDRDRALAHMIAASTLRRLGTLRALLALYLDRGPPKGAPRVETALLIGAAQIVLLDVPDHAAVDLSVRLARLDKDAQHFAGLVNAVLRRIAESGRERFAVLDGPALDTPGWLMQRWVATYGADTARAIAVAHACEPALDLTVKADAATWAERLGGTVLPTGSVRLIAHGAVSALPGFAEGAWWVQDAAAALPARLLGDVRGAKVADLCAAPGGKTAQLAQAGAEVLAVDRKDSRLQRLTANLKRLDLTARVRCCDVLALDEGGFDAVLLDAPCSATGTIRRHPDVPWTKRPQDIPPLADLQRALLDKALTLLRPGGRLVYCTCSLEREEGEAQIERLLAERTDIRRDPVTIADGVDRTWITPSGDLRTLPCHLPQIEARRGGLDGFYAARLVLG